MVSQKGVEWYQVFRKGYLARRGGQGPVYESEFPCSVLEVRPSLIINVRKSLLYLKKESVKNGKITMEKLDG